MYLYRTYGSVEDRHRTGRPRKLLPKDERDVRKALKKPGSSLRDVGNSFKVPLSHGTVANIAKRGKQPLFSKAVAKKPVLTPQHKEARLRFARANIGRDWSRVLFTDSKYWRYESSGISGRARVWVTADEQPVVFLPKKQRQVHAYGGICLLGQMGLFFVSGTTGLSSQYKLTGCKQKGVNAPEYQNVLKHAILPAAQQIYGPRYKWILM